MADNGYGDVTPEELEAEKAEIEKTYASLRFGQKIRHMGLSCFKLCGGSVSYPFMIDQDSLVGK